MSSILEDRLDIPYESSRPEAELDKKFRLCAEAAERVVGMTIAGLRPDSAR